MIIPVILSGGSGTRLWPLSRKLYPKQLLPLTGKQTLLQLTVSRLQGLENVGDPIIICNEEHRFLVAEQLRAINAKPAEIILEPVGRNTAPAIAVAAEAAIAARKDHNNMDTLLVLPADHFIANTEAFKKAVISGASWAEQGKMVTFGIVPNTPETGYGYIKRGKKLPGTLKKVKLDTFAVVEFVEKPKLATAKKYLQSGKYYWNSGMFLFQADRYLEELEKYAPKIHELSRKAYQNLTSDLDFYRLDKDAFIACPSDSVDYAVMEQTKNAVIIPIDPGWNDIGAWSSLWKVGKKDNQGNIRKGDVITYDTHDSYMYAGHRLLATVGVSNMVIVETTDAVLVAPKERVQEVKEIVNRLKAEGRQEINLHKRVFRPWGSYEGISAGDRYQVKRIIVNPHAILSLQMHHHRAEHWIVVKGTAKITRDEETFILTENESAYIPLGTKHRLENPGVIPLELIEVQSGSYLDEDDIVRFDDNYGRAGK